MVKRPLSSVQEFLREDQLSDLRPTTGVKRIQRSYRQTWIEEGTTARNLEAEVSTVPKRKILGPL